MINSESKEQPMSTNFRISSHRDRNNSLHLRLEGDFDGSSAHELINTLKKDNTKVTQVMIHTGGLKTIHPFGQDVFRKNFFILNKNNTRYIMIGRNKEKISPERN